MTAWSYHIEGRWRVIVLLFVQRRALYRPITCCRPRKQHSKQNTLQLQATCLNRRINAATLTHVGLASLQHFQLPLDAITYNSRLVVSCVPGNRAYDLATPTSTSAALWSDDVLIRRRLVL